ncbi:Phospholipase/Carboxylesterase [Rubripirellula tenax]|uniref:Phospholipase/Carboxylesterase n=1 Tax=Rubripirellula tenax TaxID=2528015 RepID=A0A5C6FHJ5_9BACT|nr:dienelactone hydrolase family protein [Rubripirellula tenax]TWU59099.1 Phospholipase/Carboxylesterase [Rubripirellula tenax]
MDRFEKPMSWNISSYDEQNSDQGPSHEHGCDQSGADATSTRPHLGFGTWDQVRSQRSFFLPVHYTPSYQYPLVVWLHSDGCNEHQVDQIMPHISLRNHVAVGVRGNRAADSSGHRFDWHDSPAAIGIAHDNIADAADEACDRFSVHSNRIVLAGYGSGGTMAMRIAMRDPRRFAAAISVGGRMPQGAIRNLNQLRNRRLPMLWQWGAKNQNYTNAGLKTDCQVAMAIGANVEIRQYPGEDEMDTVVLADIDRWIMGHVVSNTAAADERWATSPTEYSAN